MNGGAERAVYRPAEPFDTLRGLKISANRRWLAFLQWWGQDQGSDSARVVVLDLRTGEHRTLATIRREAPGRPGLRGIAWAPRDSGVAMLLRGPGGFKELRLAPLDGGPVRVLKDVPLGGLEGAGIATFDWSPDGMRLAFVVNEVPSSAFVLEHPLADTPPRSRPGS